LQVASNVARGLLCTTMCLVYPMEAFVARHIVVVLLFKGRKAHDGDDHSVLARNDRRVLVTLSLYIMSLLPALLFDSLGPVLAVTGAIGGSSLSYIGPGCCYLGIHGSEFLDMISKRWNFVSNVYHIDRGIIGDEIQKSKLSNISMKVENVTSVAKKACFDQVWDYILWYVCLMPVWCSIAEYGQYSLLKHEESEAQKSPHSSRLGNVTHQKPHLREYVQRRERENTDNTDISKPSLIRADSLPKPLYASEFVPNPMTPLLLNTSTIQKKCNQKFRIRCQKYYTSI